MGRMSAGIGVLLTVLLWTALSEEAVPRNRGAMPLSLGRIVGGVDATEGQVPYMVALYHGYDTSENGDVSLVCGGSIYDEYTVITAAHCVKYVSPSGLCVRNGTIDISNIKKRNQCLSIDKITIHAGFSYYTLENDIALLHLRDGLTFGDKVKPVSLPSPECDYLPAGTPVIISGWGYTSEGSAQVSNKLQVATVNVMGHSDCNAIYDKEGWSIPETQLCAAAANKDTCQGDSGGPLVVGTVLHGVTSWGIGCARPQYPGVYTRVCRYRQWIQDHA